MLLEHLGEGNAGAQGSAVEETAQCCAVGTWDSSHSCRGETGWDCETHRGDGNNMGPGSDKTAGGSDSCTQEPSVEPAGAPCGPAHFHCCLSRVWMSAQGSSLYRTICAFSHFSFTSVIKSSPRGKLFQ